MMCRMERRFATSDACANFITTAGIQQIQHLKKLNLIAY